MVTARFEIELEPFQLGPDFIVPVQKVVDYDFSDPTRCASQ